MTEDSGFHNLHAADELKFVKHNPTDFEAFRKFQDELDDKFSQAEIERERRERKKNLELWGDLVGPRWATASLKTIENEARDEVIECLKKDRMASFFIHGESSSGKSYLAYALLRAFIGSGWTTPSQIERISEEVLLGMAATGFEGMARFNKLLIAKNKVYLFDGVGSKKSYSDKEKQLWEQLIDHIYTHSLTAVFTSNGALEDFGCQLSDSGDSKLQHLVGHREIESKSTRSAPKKTAAAKVRKSSASSAKSTKKPAPAFGEDGALL